MPQKKWVNLGFYKGASLTDNNKLLEGTGKQLRHIKVHDLSLAKNENVKALISQAIEERKTHFSD